GVTPDAVEKALKRYDPAAYRLERERRKAENRARRKEADRARKRTGEAREADRLRKQEARRTDGADRRGGLMEEIIDLALREARRLYPSDRNQAERTRSATRLQLRITYAYLVAAALDAAAARNPATRLRKWGVSPRLVAERYETLVEMVNPAQRRTLAELLGRIWPSTETGEPDGNGAATETPAAPCRPARRLTVSTRELVTTYAASVYRRVPGVWDGEKCVWVRRERWVPEVRQAGLKTYSVPLVPVPEGNGGKKVERGVAWSGLTRT
ncbi:MAG: hypothetical protein ACUVRF_11440, partial [Desulfotomaculales bacterium]